MSSGTVSKIENIPYWLVNVPKSQWTAQCPDFIANASERDREMLSIPDSQYRRLSWDDVQEIISRSYDLEAGACLLMHVRDQSARPFQAYAFRHTEIPGLHR